MRELDRLHEIIDAPQPQQVHALLTLLAPPSVIGDEDFARRLAEAPQEESERPSIARRKFFAYVDVFRDLALACAICIHVTFVVRQARGQGAAAC